jgi:hypothetical protein
VTGRFQEDKQQRRCQTRLECELAEALTPGPGGTLPATADENRAMYARMVKRLAVKVGRAKRSVAVDMGGAGVGAESGGGGGGAGGEDGGGGGEEEGGKPQQQQMNFAQVISPPRWIPTRAPFRFQPFPSLTPPPPPPLL